MKKPGTKVRAGSKARVFSHDRSDRSDTTISADAIATTEHDGGKSERGWCWISIDRIGFDISAQLTIENAVKLRNQLTEAIDKANKKHACTRVDCYECKRGRYAPTVTP